jgi:hypothetical protein
MLDDSRLITENADRLIANLPPVAVRAMKEIATPSFANPWDFRQIVSDARRDEDAPRRQHPASGETDEETRLDRRYSIIDHLDRVFRKLSPPGSQQLRGRHPVA